MDKQFTEECAGLLDQIKRKFANTVISQVFQEGIYKRLMKRRCLSTKQVYGIHGDINNMKQLCGASMNVATVSLS